MALSTLFEHGYKYGKSDKLKKRKNYGDNKIKKESL
jgi:hypothetical protein